MEFYGSILGLTVAYRSEPAFALIKVEGAGSIGLLWVHDASKEGAEEMTPRQRRSIHVELSVENLDAAYQELLDRDMTFHQAPHDEPWNRVMTGFDPDGYSAEIAQGRLGESGAIWTEKTGEP